MNSAICKIGYCLSNSPLSEYIFIEGDKVFYDINYDRGDTYYIIYRNVDKINSTNWIEKRFKEHFIDIQDHRDNQINLLIY